jgi:CBS domain-containing protein
MMEKALEFLSTAPPFSLLPPGELRALLATVEEVSHPAGEILYRQSKSRLDRVMVVKSGALELYFDQQDEITLRSFLGPGDVFGGISLLRNNGVALRTVRVVENSSFWVIPGSVFLDCCQRNRSFRAFFEEALEQRLLNEAYAAAMVSGQAGRFLAGVDPFTFLPEDYFERLTGQISLVHYPKDTILFVQGRSRIQYLYIVQKGAAEQYLEEGEDKKLYSLLGEGDIYGGISMLLNNGLSVRTVRVREDTYFYVLPRKAFLETCAQFESFSEFFTDTFGKSMLDRSYAATIARTFQPEHESLQFFNQPVSSIYNRNLVTCGAETSIREAATIMSGQGCSSVFIREADGDIVGVLTDNDLRKKVIAEGYDTDRPVSGVMTTPLQTISAGAPVFEALLSMTQMGIKHLGVTGSGGQVSGVVTQRDLLVAQEQSAFFLVREIGLAESVDDIGEKRAQLPKAVQGLIKSGVSAQNVTRLITAISTAVNAKLMAYALEELGPPPVRFVFMLLGSEGRKEQTLKTDQDNAIIFEDVPEKSREEVQRYFLALGDKVCTWLDRVGYAFCKGDVMARNPQWCQPLAKWQDYFATWINTAEPEALLRASIFFDFRAGDGDRTLVDQLRAFLFESLVSWAGFFRRMTENALHFKPPLGFFRNFVVESKGKHRNSFDIKSAMLPLVDLARIYALKSKIGETNTFERLHQVFYHEGLSWQDYQELEHAYGFLMQLRLYRQVSAILDEKVPPDNYINPKKLTRIEQTISREIFVRIEKFQTKLSLDFLGIA